MKRQSLKTYICAGVFTLLLGTTAMSTSTMAQSVSEIRINGAERIDPATVISYMDVKVGENFTEDTLSKSLKSLFKTGLFADVTLFRDGDNIIVELMENPVINEVVFEGNKEISNENLSGEAQLRPRTVFTRNKIIADVDRLKEIYRLSGRFSATIEPKIIKLDQNRVNVVFEIQEGPETRIRRVNIIGNKQFDDEKLKSIIRSKEAAWYRFITSDDKYDPDRLAFDKELLRRFYLNVGYADFQVESAIAELTPDGEDFFVTFTITEGERYAINGVKIESRVPELDTTALNQFLMMKKGDWYNAGLVDENIVKLTDEVGNLQYAFVDIRPNVQRNRDERKVDITYTLNEGKKVFVERINIAGNVRTLDEVVRREMLLIEGDPYNTAKLKKSETRIRDLTFFDNVEIKHKEGSSPEKTVIDIAVQEKSTGELSLGAGFSTSDGPLADFRIKEKNLLGKGQELSLSTTLSSLRTEFDVRFTEPYFMQRDLRAGVDASHITRNLKTYSSYNLQQTAFGLRMGYPLAQYWRQNLNYRVERNQIRDVDSNASRYIKDQEGDRITSSISQRLTYDARDSKVQSTNGLLAYWSAEFAGIGGDARYIKNRLGATYFYPLAKKIIFRADGETGYVFSWGDEDIQINERFFLGGKTLRGFERSGIGPRDVSTDDALGGNFYYRGSMEVGFPTGLPEEFGVKGHLFSDFGTLMTVDSAGPEVVDDGTLRVSLGVGASWRSPLGPIRVDVAKPLLSEDYDKEEVFRFSFGTGF